MAHKESAVKKVTHVLKLDPALMLELKRMAADSELPLGVYLKFLIRDHIRAPKPFEFRHAPKGKRTA
jgi:hypothetical protein